MTRAAVELRAPERVWLESRRPGADGRSFLFEEPAGQIVATRVAEVRRAVADAERAVGGGLHVVAVLSYEAAPAFDAALAAHGAGTLPPAWFGLYRRRRDLEPDRDEPPTGAFALGAWTPCLSRAEHERAVRRIRQDIAAGDVYQVSFTFDLQAPFAGDAAGLYRQLCRAQGNAAFCAFLDLGPVALLSASPELFFALDGDGAVTARPMKGTRRRGRWLAEDQALAQELAASAKDRAENVMIVDLLRNDLGRVAVAGSVRVAQLWQVEAYDTVWQMTSTVAASLRPEVGLLDLLAALFPCGSITGAPKVRATQIIRQLEAGPRGAYTGAIGFLSPTARPGVGRLAGVEGRFCVAIRTVTVDRTAGRASAGVGGGITWDSDPAAEYAECLDKARFLERARASAGPWARPRFELLETLLFEPATGYYLLARHLQRLRDSARYFGFALDEALVCARLEAAVAGARGAQRARLLLAKDGTVAVTVQDLQPTPPVLCAAVAAARVDSGDVFLYHKTTCRGVYERALAGARAAGADEAILVNERGEVTQTTRGNLVVDVDGVRCTPPVTCGLLPGTLRAELLETGQIAERPLRLRDLSAAADAVYLVNSVRRWVRLDVQSAVAATSHT